MDDDAAAKLDDLESRFAKVDDLESRFSEVDDVRANVSSVGEALGIIRAMLADIVGDGAEYAADLDRLDALAHLIR